MQHGSGRAEDVEHLMEAKASRERVRFLGRINRRSRSIHGSSEPDKQQSLPRQIAYQLRDGDQHEASQKKVHKCVKPSGSLDEEYLNATGDDSESPDCPEHRVSPHSLESIVENGGAATGDQDVYGHVVDFSKDRFLLLRGLDPVSTAT